MQPTAEATTPKQTVSFEEFLEMPTTRPTPSG